MPRPPRRSRLLVAAALAAPSLVLASGALAAEAPTDTEGVASEATVVTVASYAFSPDPVEVTAGSDVRWRWQGEERHSVTADDNSFDSDPECQDGPVLRDSCRTGGDPDFTWTAPEVAERTEITYRCKLHGASEGMTGTVVVIPAPAPSPSPSPSAAPSPSPSASGSEREPDSTEEPSPEQDDSSSDPGPQYGPPPALGTQTAPGSSSSSVASPQVAEPVEDPELEPFPSPAAIPSPSASPSDLGEVAVDLPDDGGDGVLRKVLLTVATVAVGGTAIAFGSLVLFGPRWR